MSCIKGIVTSVLEGKPGIISAEDSMLHASSQPEFNAEADKAKALHFKRHLYPKTKVMIHHKNAHMFVSSFRGAQGLVPTKKYLPALHRRRYSVDVSTDGWGQISEVASEKTDSRPIKPPSKFSAHDDLDMLNPHEVVVGLPDPRRFASLNQQHDDAQARRNPPANEGNYLEIGDATLSNNDFHQIMDVQFPVGWWNDDILATALEIVMKDDDCRKFGIEIANSMISSILYLISACNATDLSGYESERGRFQNAAFIFLPINDAFGETVNDGTSGTHWSYVFINRYTGEAQHIDSMYNNGSFHRTSGQHTVHGLEQLLDEEYAYFVEPNSPQQFQDNEFLDDSGACGPFTFAMIQHMAGQIREAHCEGQQQQVRYLFDPSSYQITINSWKIRKYVCKRVRHYKRLAQLKLAIDQSHQLADAHNQEALGEQNMSGMIEDTGTEFDSTTTHDGDMHESDAHLSNPTGIEESVVHNSLGTDRNGGGGGGEGSDGDGHTPSSSSDEGPWLL